MIPGAQAAAAGYVADTAEDVRVRRGEVEEIRTSDAVLEAVDEVQVQQAGRE